MIIAREGLIKIIILQNDKNRFHSVQSLPSEAERGNRGRALTKSTSFCRPSEKDGSSSNSTKKSKNNHLCKQESQQRERKGPWRKTSNGEKFMKPLIPTSFPPICSANTETTLN